VPYGEQVALSGNILGGGRDMGSRFHSAGTVMPWSQTDLKPNLRLNGPAILNRTAARVTLIGHEHKSDISYSGQTGSHPDLNCRRLDVGCQVLEEGTVVGTRETVQTVLCELMSGSQDE
jgi:hypothetical protein